VQDFAAGVLLIREAGGVVMGIDGRADVWRSDVVIAGTPETCRDLRRVLGGD
jgi:myo-inositol-1(or 4)-monophosphatase